MSSQIQSHDIAKRIYLMDLGVLGRGEMRRCLSGWWQAETVQGSDSSMPDVERFSPDMENTNSALPLKDSPAINFGEFTGTVFGYYGNLRDQQHDIGTNVLQMKSYVDIQGSGENVTKITGTRSLDLSGILMGANNVVVRSLTVENTATGTYAHAIYNYMASPIITNVTAITSGGTYKLALPTSLLHLPR